MKWLRYALALACAVLLVHGVSTSRQAARLATEVTEAREAAREARGREREATRAQERAEAERDSLAAIADSARAAVDTLVITRWETVTDSTPVEVVRAVADTVIAACRSALHACAIARAAEREAFVRQADVLDATRAERDAIARERDALRRQTERKPSLLPTAVLVGGGCGGGFALRGLRGCAEGAAVGLTVDVLRRAFNSYRESFR